MRKQSVIVLAVVILVAAFIATWFMARPRQENIASWRSLTLARLKQGLHSDRPLVISTVDLSLPNPTESRDALTDNSEFITLVKENQIELLTNEYRFNFENRFGSKTADDFVPDSEPTQIAMRINQIIHEQSPEYQAASFYQPRFIIVIPGDSKLYFPNTTDHVEYISELITTRKEPMTQYPRPGGTGHGGQ